jgi:endonuclease YncB( thermonuclease family)
VQARTVGRHRLGRVRLLGIDAPETAYGARAAQCGGPAAARTLSRLLPAGSTVMLVADPGQADRDVYGRLLRYVEVGGRDAGEQMLALGAARPTSSRPRLAREDRYAAAAAHARARRAGLWGACP